MKIFDVIKGEMNNDTFVWKFPGENFNTHSTLIVHETQEAAFFNEGRLTDIFKPGTYKLHTKNIPVLSKLINLPSDGISPFHCEVYFANKTVKMAINWGVGGVKYSDPEMKLPPFDIGTSGEMSVKIADLEKILTKLVGTENCFDQEHLMRYFKGIMISCIKQWLPRILKEENTSIFELEKNLMGIAEQLKKSISGYMLDYGIMLVDLYVNNISVSDDDPNYQTYKHLWSEKVFMDMKGENRIKEAEINAKVRITEHTADEEIKKGEAIAQSIANKILEQTEHQRRAFNAIDIAAANEGVGKSSAPMMGVGMGMGMAPFINQTMSSFGKEIQGSSLMTPVTGNDISNVNTELNREADDGEDIPGMIHLKTVKKSRETQSNEKEQIDDEEYLKRVKRLKMAWEEGLYTEEEFKIEREKLKKL